MRPLLFVALACALLGVAALAPTAAADITIPIDLNGDRDCDDPGETISIPAPIHRHGRCNV